MAKINPQTLRKLNLYKQNPDIVQPLSNAELADLVVLVLNQVELIDNSIKDKTVDINKMLTANVNELLAEYKRTAAQAKEETKEAIAEARKAAQDSTAATNAAIEDVVQRVQARLDNLSDGQDGIVTEAEIARAAEIAATLIELPDFEQMVQTEITSNGERVRDALELLQGENRYRVQQEDVEGLRDDLKKLWDAVVAKSAGQGGTIGKGQVYGFIQQAIADGIIQSSITTIDEIGDVETTGATDGQVLTWVDSNERWEAVDAPGASGGEANTASNVGTGGVGIFKQKSLVDLQFKKLNAGSAKVTITDDTGNDEVDIDIDESAISYNNIADTPTIPSGALADLDTVGTAQIDNDAVTLDKIADAAVVTEAEGIASNDNDTTLPTSAAVKDYVDNNTPSGTVDVVSNVATSTILGRTTAGSGDSEELTAAQVRTLINVEDGADVTDTANVTAAGALMDSEVTNLAEVKAFDPADYATAAQGTTADSALQPTDIASSTITPRTGAINFSGGSDGDVLTVQADGSLAPEAPSGGGGNTYFNNEYIDSSGADDYGTLTGLVNGSNTTFTVSQSAYQTGTLEVYLNGKLVQNGAGNGWTENTPASGTFDFVTAPESGDVIHVRYQTQTLSSDTVITDATTDVSASSWVIDEDNMASDSATKVPTQQSVKAYVDGAVASGVSDGDKGDITVSASGATWTIDNDVVTYAKMQNVSATDRLLGRDTAGAGDVEELTPAAVRTMLNVEDGADVTDTANVTAAGALMDSEVTNLAAVKAFDPTDYATAAQGATADSALQDITSESLGDLANVTESTPGNDEVLQYVTDHWENQTLAEAGIQAVLSEGAFVNGDKTKLDGIETGADVTDTANVTAAGALMDSEVTNLAAVKAFAPTDYATAAQGSTADSALQPGDVDDTPVNGATTAPVSSNWAYDHAAASNPHSTTAADVSALPDTTPFIKSITFEDPTDSEDITIFYTDDAITITQLNAVLAGGSSTPSVTYTVRHSSDRSATGNEVVTSGSTVTSTTTGAEVTSFNDATIPAGSWVWLETTAQSGTVPEFHLTIEFTRD